jgi:preprotein translocase subunit YajC
MFATPAMAQTVGAAGPFGLDPQISSFGLMALVFILFYFLMIRPQQQRAKQLREAVNSVKRGDTIVLNSGMIGKVVRVEEAEVGVEIAQGVTVKVVKSMIAEVRTRGAPVPANDAKS